MADADLCVGEGFDDELACCVCLDSWKDPVELRPCGHIMCRNCLPASVQTCPSCREQIQGKRQPNRTIVNLALSVKVRCTKCQWTGTRESSKNHPCSTGNSSRTSQGLSTTNTTTNSSNYSTTNNSRGNRYTYPNKPARTGDIEVANAFQPMPSGEASYVSRTSQRQGSALSSPHHSVRPPQPSQPRAPDATAFPSSMPAAPSCGASSRNAEPPSWVARQDPSGGPGGYLLHGSHDEPRVSHGPQQYEYPPQHMQPPTQARPSYGAEQGGYPPQHMRSQMRPSGAEPDGYPPQHMRSQMRPSGAEPDGYPPQHMQPQQTPWQHAPPKGVPNFSPGRVAMGHPQRPSRPQEQQDYHRGGGSMRYQIIQPPEVRPWAAYDMTQDEYDQLVSLFLRFDEDDNRHLDHSEVTRLMRTLNFANTTEDVDRIFADMDVDGSGVLTLPKLLTWCKYNKPNREALYGLTQSQYNTIMMQFHTYDVNQDGLLELRDFCNLVRGSREARDEESAKQLFRSIDRNNRGSINLHEFLLFRVGRR